MGLSASDYQHVSICFELCILVTGMRNVFVLINLSQSNQPHCLPHSPEVNEGDSAEK